MGDLIFGTERHHLPAREVGPVIGDDGMRKPEMTHCVLPREFDNLFFHDAGERHCFHPLSEVVCGN